MQSYIKSLWQEDENITDDTSNVISRQEALTHRSTVVERSVAQLVLFQIRPVWMQPDSSMSARGGDFNNEMVKVSMGSELCVLSGVYAGLVSLFQAAAVDGKLLWDMSQRI